MLKNSHFLGIFAPICLVIYDWIQLALAQKSEVTLLPEGGCPQRADVVIANNTKYELDLDLNESCGRECDHKGEITTLLYIYNN